MDGSYMGELAEDVCLAGVVLFCNCTGQMATISVAERTNDRTASNYRGELLGGLIAMLLLHAASQDTTRQFMPIHVYCDNIGMVGHGNKFRQSLPEKQVQLDVLLVIRNILCDLPFPVHFHHVYGHEDRHTAFGDLLWPNSMSSRIMLLKRRYARLSAL